MTQRIGTRYKSISLAAVVGLAQGTTDVPQNVESVDNKLTVANYVWSSSDLAWVAQLYSTGGGGGAASTLVDANLTSAGSTRSVGTVTVGNPTTSVSLSSQITVSASGTTSVDLSSGGSTRVVGTVNNATSTGVIGAVSLATAGTTSTLGQVAISNPTTSVSLSSQITASVTGTTAVTLAAGSSATLVGAVILGTAGSTANTAGSVALLAGSTANLVGTVILGTAGSTANTAGSVALLAGGSSIGSVQQGLGSSNNFWVTDGFAFSSALTSRTSISTTVDTAIVAANANQKSLVIANLSTSQIVALGLSTAAVTTALGNVSVYLQPADQITFGGMQGKFPNYTGAIRGINISSTTVGGGVAVTRFINT